VFGGLKVKNELQILDEPGAMEDGDLQR